MTVIHDCLLNNELKFYCLDGTFERAKVPNAKGIPLGKAPGEDLLGRAPVPLGGVKTKILPARSLLPGFHRCVFTPTRLRDPATTTCLTTPRPG